MRSANIAFSEHEQNLAAPPALLRRLMKVPELAFERTLGMSPAALAEYAEAAAKTHAALQATAPGQPQPVFNFILGSNSHGRPSEQVSQRLL
jgi:hypothetical protein